MFQKELKECVVVACTLEIKIPTDVIGEIVGLKGIWQQVVKDVSYRHLDLTI
jgi:hypothetical protein